ncbi:MAG: lamin tail domain-containing protein, partial [Flavobacteriales bacterium]|nr:lamin tail domain-containing protein [Flavobacteriales bacterium]
SLRWTNTDCCEQPRLDDIELTGTSAGGCGIGLGTASTTCITNTSGEDTYTLNIPYTGSQPGLSVINNSGSGGNNSGNDPAVEPSGTMMFVGIAEGTAYTIGFSSPCASLTLAGPSPSCDPLPEIRINEILADPDAIAGDANGDGIVNTSQDEFVEIINTGAAASDISDWTIRDGFGVRHTFPMGTNIPAGCSIIVFGGGSPTGSFGNALVQNASTGMLGLNNDGDVVELRDGSSTVVSAHTYGAEGGNNTSLTRDPDMTGNFVLHIAATGAGGALFSPGTLVDGSPFIGCQPADPCPLAQDGIANFDENTCTCESGYYATLEMVGQDEVITSCIICPPGRYCPDGIVSILCPAGRFQAQEGQTSCTECTAGSFNPSPGATECQDCLPGYFSGTDGAVECEPCAAGEFNDQFGAQTCLVCPAGTANPSMGATECVACPPGSSSGPGAMECTPDLTCTTDLSLD